MLKTWEHTYAASPDDVFEMLADPAFRSRVNDGQEMVSYDVSLERDGDGFTLVNDQLQNTAGLPALAKKIVGDTTRAIQREEWADRTGGTITVDAPGAPTDIKGSTKLTPAGDGTLQVTEFDVKVKVPLIGSKLEPILTGTIDKAITIEFAVGDAWLAGDR